MSGFGNIFTFTLFVVAAVYSYAAVTTKPTTTHSPTTTKETNELESYSFLYNPYGHRLYVRHDETINNRRHRSCWIGQLSDPESAAVHTPFGMRALEVKMLAKLSSAVEMTMVDMNPLDKHVCRALPNGTVTVYRLPV